MSSPPLIGVSTSEDRDAHCLDAIAAAGGLPVILPPLPEGEVDALLDRLEGVCLAGGPDLRFELHLARRARERGVPLLAVSRGTEILNVARGGTLAEASAEHVTQRVEVDPDSRLAALLGRTELEVDSVHDRAVDRVGDGLRVVARAQDGTVEAVEATEPGFTVGVQWHAERLTERPEQQRLLRAFVRACARPATELRAA